MSGAKQIEEGHQNYVRMYNMLTGIRFCVSRVHAKIPNPLTDADFKHSKKYSFDITGSELTPSAKYDFKFKDYAPWVFREIRNAFGIDPAEYLVSLTAKYILSELGSPGKSGSFFYFSRDYTYIIKTIRPTEHRTLWKRLKDYYEHVSKNPNTLLSQFYGLYRVKLPYGKKIHFIVMNNLFPPHRDIHQTFDLKGSTIGRDYNEELLKQNPHATLKDLNWLRRDLRLHLGPQKRAQFMDQLNRDVAFLQRLEIMDYSLLVGIHDLQRGNDENLLQRTLQVFQPGDDEPRLRPLARTPSKLESAARARELRVSVQKERPKPLGQTIVRMPDESNPKGSQFYADDGGYRATDQEDLPAGEIYYLGIVDCLTRYNYVKKSEHFIKSFKGNEDLISPIPPVPYGDRFSKFVSSIISS
ncbi:SAICAR synthase-like protein [Piedraia hortae CBS 480.64]|uniref:1-phosphatidylinositol-4-phosphate 5-kinase n=1 Tax=Piedraia hortae CBS 480.64 TaxID=1314780 RepID=A0A6A7C3S7_9PEZI|nr:SAICAR synthase-like protein [Piedraia hortae CBS 480.64]